MTALPRIPYYHIDRVINSGGTATVYYGLDLRSGYPVAIKALYPSRAKDDYILEHFREEANNYLYLSHPNITKLVEFIEDEGRFYIVMELVDGLPLDEFQRTRTGPIAEELAIPMFMQILDTITYLHKEETIGGYHRGEMLHLDIKPNNIMVLSDKKIKVLDMGISALLNDKTNNLKICGTPAFMPPEQFEHGELGKYTDVFALGVTLFSMLTAQLPYTGDSHTEIWQKIKTGRVPRATDFYHAISPCFQPILEKAMHKDHAVRYQTCDEFKIELERAINTNS